jgi:hypothetical protein
MKPEHDALSRYLNGELQLADLPESLRKEAEGFERIIGVLDRGPVKLPFRVRAAVMARVRAVEASPWRRAWTWVVAPRLSPLAGAVAVAATVAAVLLVGPGRAGPDLPSATEAGMVTRFVYMAPTATRVAVTGDFVNWEPAGIPLEPRGNGVWIAELRLQPGLHYYVFVIDGTEWRPDPSAASQMDDGFGQQNSVLLVPGRKVS